jgi:hypothetical protein
MKMTPRTAPAGLHVRLVAGRDVELSCRCGYTRRQALRDPIAPTCPKCGRRWR